MRSPVRHGLSECILQNGKNLRVAGGCMTRRGSMSIMQLLRHKLRCLIPGLGEDEAPSLMHVNWMVLATGLAANINCTAMNK